MDCVSFPQEIHAAANLSQTLYIMKEHSGTLNTSVEIAADDYSTTIFVARKRAFWDSPPAHVSSWLGPSSIHKQVTARA